MRRIGERGPAMDVLERHCIRGFLVDAMFATKHAAPPSRGKRSCIWVPFPTQELGGAFSVTLRRPPIILPISSSSSSSSSSSISLPFAAASSEDAAHYFVCNRKLDLNSFAFSQVQTDALTSDSPVETTDSSETTVRVRFVLQKECFFGQQFFIVGNDPTFGVWDPANAIPLEWSADHVWTAELDVPAEKMIQFKFILKGLSGDISWQPGPDRSLQTWETNETIVISEDWDDAGCQKVTEEHRGVFIGVDDEPQSSELNFGGNNGAVEDETPVPDSAPVPASGSALDPSQETMVANVLYAPSKSVEAEHDNSPQFSEEGDGSEGPIRNQVQEETVAPFRQPNDIESEEVKSIDGAMSGDKDVPKEADLKSMAGIIHNGIQWGGRAIKQFLSSLGIIPP